MSDRKTRGSRRYRPAPEVRGWLTSREYALAIRKPWSTVRRWCIQGAVADLRGERVPVEGGDGHDYRIPLRALT